MSARSPHIPVLLDKVTAALAISNDDVIVDGTFGAGGYSRAILDAGAARVIGLDRDPDAIAAGPERLPDERLTLIETNFGRMDEALGQLVDQSLVRRLQGPGVEPRFVMLELLRERARELLTMNDEAEVRERHLQEHLADLGGGSAPGSKR